MCSDNIEDTLRELNLLRKESPQSIQLNIIAEIGSHLLAAAKPVLMCAQPSHQIDQPISFAFLLTFSSFDLLVSQGQLFPPVANRRRGPKASTNLLLGTLHVSLCRSPSVWQWRLGSL